MAATLAVGRGPFTKQKRPQTNQGAPSLHSLPLPSVLLFSLILLPLAGVLLVHFVFLVLPVARQYSLSSLNLNLNLNLMHIRSLALTLALITLGCILSPPPLLPVRLAGLLLLPHLTHFLPQPMTPIRPLSLRPFIQLDSNCISLFVLLPRPFSSFPSRQLPCLRLIWTNFCKCSIILFPPVCRRSGLSRFSSRNSTLGES